MFDIYSKHFNDIVHTFQLGCKKQFFVIKNHTIISSNKLTLFHALFLWFKKPLLNLQKVII